MLLLSYSTQILPNVDLNFGLNGIFFFKKPQLKYGQSYSYVTDIDGKLQLSRFQTYAQLSCGTNLTKVTGTFVSAGEALNCILLGYI